MAGGRKAVPDSLVRIWHRPEPCSGAGSADQTILERSDRGAGTKPKLVKRQMYGRANLDLLQATLWGQLLMYNSVSRNGAGKQ
jgi:hypothetical protein